MDLFVVEYFDVKTSQWLFRIACQRQVTANRHFLNTQKLGYEARIRIYQPAAGDKEEG